MTGVQLLQGITAGSLWAQELEQLATRAEALDNRPEPATLAELVELAGEAHRYLFLAFSPATIARSCRLSARLHVPVLSVPALDEQVDSVHQVRWRVHGQVGDVPADTPAAAPAPCPPGLVDDDLDDLPDHQEPEAPAIATPVPARPKRQLRPAHERVPSRAAQEPAPPAPRIEPSPEPQPPALTTPPPNWLTTAEAAELLGVSIATISNWRHRGRFGAEGVGYVQVGRTCWHSPEAVEAIEAGNMPPELDQLLADVQAA